MDTRISRRALLKSGGLLVVSLGLGRLGEKVVRAQAAPPDVALGKTVAVDAVDGFLAIHPDGAVTLFSGKVDLGTGVRAALRQIVAEELDVAIARIRMVEGDTALTPDQGATAGSYTIARGGATLRQAAATARGALLRLAAERFGRPATDLEIVDGVVRVSGGGPALSYGELIGGQRFDLPIDPKAPRKKPADYKIVGRPVPRPDVPAKVTGQHLYVHDFVLPNMLHGRVIRPPAIGATLLSVDERSVTAIPGVRIVRIKNFLAVAAEREWNAVRAARALKAAWSAGSGLPDRAALFDTVRATAVARDQTIAKRGDAKAALAGSGRRLAATYQWPIQTHGSDPAEHGSALPHSERGGGGALAPGHAPPPLEHPGAGEDRQHLRHGIVLRRTGGRGGTGPARTPAALPDRSPRDRGAAAGGRAPRVDPPALAAEDGSEGFRVAGARPRLRPLQAR